MMRWQQPLVIDGEVRRCPECGANRDWTFLCLRDDSVWLRCRAGHETSPSPSLGVVGGHEDRAGVIVAAKVQTWAAEEE